VAWALGRATKALSIRARWDICSLSGFGITWKIIAANEKDENALKLTEIETRNWGRVSSGSLGKWSTKHNGRGHNGGEIALMRAVSMWKQWLRPQRWRSWPSSEKINLFRQRRAEREMYGRGRRLMDTFAASIFGELFVLLPARITYSLLKTVGMKNASLLPRSLCLLCRAWHWKENFVNFSI
jgi:hypothetical protein